MSAVLTAKQAAELQASGRIRVMWRDDAAAHQVRVHKGEQSNLLAVTCVCRQRAGLPPVEARTRWEPEEALAAYRSALLAEGVA